MKRHKHLFEQVASLPNLLGAARHALRGKRSRQPGASFFMELERELVLLHEELQCGSYRPGAYHYFTIREPKERLVAAAPFRDRVVHHVIVRVIQPLFERRFIEDSFASRPGKGTHAAMRRAALFAKQYRYALKCDVRKCFPSIDHELLLTLVARVIGDPRLLHLISNVVDSHHDRIEQCWPPGGDLFDVKLRKRGLPIGNLTSQFFANVYLNPLDHFVKHELRVRGYVRYLDDFLLFSDDRYELKQQGFAVQAKLAELRLTMHPDKYRMLPTQLGVDFVGYVVFADGRSRVRSSSVRRFARRYRRMLWELRHRCRPAAEVTQSVKAWVAHTSHAQSLGLRREVLGRRRAAGRRTKTQACPGSNSSSFRGLRGGNWNNNSNNLAASNRNRREAAEDIPSRPRNMSGAGDTGDTACLGGTPGTQHVWVLGRHPKARRASLKVLCPQSGPSLKMLSPQSGPQGAAVPNPVFPNSVSFLTSVDDQRKPRKHKAVPGHAHSKVDRSGASAGATSATIAPVSNREDHEQRSRFSPAANLLAEVTFNVHRAVENAEDLDPLL